MALTPGEKRDLARNIQKGMTVICSSIAQLHLASPDPAATRDDTGIITSLRQLGNNQWKFTNIEGALLLVRDPAGYCFFKIYDMDKYKLRFHYELYDNLEYKSLSPNFHAFEMEGCVCGFNFSSKDVANKFLNRVQKTIPRSVAGVGSTAPQDPSMLFSPGFRKGPPLPSRRQDTPPKEKRNTTVTEASSNSGNSLQPSKTKSDVYTSNSNLYLETGLLDAENIPLEWKRILKNAGIRKKDLKDPTMQEIIKQTLEQYNISIQPPPLDLDNEAVREYYTPAQLLEYEKYKKEMAQYEQELDKYNKEMQEYQEFQKRQERLDAWAKNNRVTTMSGDEGLKNLRNSVMLFQGKGVSNLLPEMELENVMKPRMSMNKPYLPALPVIPEANEVEKESTVERSSRGKKGQKKKDKAPKRKDSNLERMEKLGGMMSERSSKLIIKADFLKDIKKNNIQLKHVSVLPDLSGMKKDDKAGLLHALITRIQDRRQFLEDDKSSDSGEFSDPDE